VFYIRKTASKEVKTAQIIWDEYSIKMINTCKHDYQWTWYML